MVKIRSLGHAIYVLDEWLESHARLEARLLHTETLLLANKILAENYKALAEHWQRKAEREPAPF